MKVNPSLGKSSQDELNEIFLGSGLEATNS